MAGNVISQLVVELLDRVSEPARQMQEALGGISGAIRDTNAQAPNFGEQLDSAITRNNRAIAQTRGQMVDAVAGAYLLARGLSAPISVAADFEQGMNRVRVLSGATEEQFEALSAQARELGRTTMFSASEAADGMTFLAQAGFDADQVLGALPGTLQLAAAGQMGLAEAADIASNVLAGYRKDVGELGHVNDVLAATFTSTNTNLSQLGEAMSYAAPFASSAGLAFEEASAAIGLLGSAGIQGSRAGSALGQVINKALNPTAQMRAEMEELGLSFTDSEGRMLPLVDVVRQLEEHSEDAGLASRLFGQRAGPAMAALVGMGADELERLTLDLENAGGTAQRVADVEMEGFNGRVRAMRSAIEGAQLAIGGALLPALTILTERLTDALGPVTRLAEEYPKVTAGVVGLTAAVIAFRIAAIGVRFVGLHLYGAILGVAKVAWVATTAVTALTTAMAASAFGAFAAGATRARRSILAFTAAAHIGGTSFAIRALGASVLGAVNPLRLISRVLPTAASGFKVLRVALIASPIGAALAGVAAAGTWIYNNWSGLRELFAGFAEGFSAAIEPIRPAIDTVVDGFRHLFSWVAAPFKAMFDWVGRLTGPLDASAEDWREWGRVAGQAVGDFLNFLVGIPARIGEVVTSIIEWFQRIPDRVGDAFAEMRERIQAESLLNLGADLMGSFLAGMAEKWLEIQEWALLLPLRIIDAIAGTNLTEAGRDLMQSFRDGMAERFERVRDAAGGWVSEIRARIATDGLMATGTALIGGLFSGMTTRWIDPQAWAARIPSMLATAIGTLGLLDCGRELVSGLLSGAQQGLRAMLEWAGNLVEDIAGRIAEDGLLQVGRDLIRSLWDGAVQTFTDFLSWVRRIPSEIRNAIGQIDLSNIITWPTRPDWLGGGGGSVMDGVDSSAPGAAPSSRLGLPDLGLPSATDRIGIDGARRRGGPISAGGTYVVGEDGVEVITPTRSGYVHPIDEMPGARQMADRTVRQDFHVTITPSIHIEGDNARDPRAIADEVAREIEQSVRRAFRGVMADTGMRTV